MTDKSSKKAFMNVLLVILRNFPLNLKGSGNIHSYISLMYRKKMSCYNKMNIIDDIFVW